MQVEPYLNLNGRCEEALEFYRDAVGAEVGALMRFKEAPDQKMVPPGAGEKVMHCTFRIGNSTLMASDGMGGGHTPIGGFSLAIGVDTVEEGRRVFNALAEGGQVEMDFAPTFWSPGFGQLADRFGVKWMVNVVR